MWRSNQGRQFEKLQESLVEVLGKLQEKIREGCGKFSGDSTGPSLYSVSFLFLRGELISFSGHLGIIE